MALRKDGVSKGHLVLLSTCPSTNKGPGKSQRDKFEDYYSLMVGQTGWVLGSVLGGQS